MHLSILAVYHGKSDPFLAIVGPFSSEEDHQSFERSARRVAEQYGLALAVSGLNTGMLTGPHVCLGEYDFFAKLKELRCTS